MQHVNSTHKSHSKVMVIGRQQECSFGTWVRRYLGSWTSSSGTQQIIEDIILPVPVPVQGLVIAVCLPFASPRVRLYLKRLEELSMSQGQSL